MSSIPKAPLSQKFPLLAFPPELHLLILPHLSVAERQLLRATCRYFRNLIDPLKSKKDYLDIEMSVYNIGKYYCCSTCCTLRRFDILPYDEYQHRQIRGWPDSKHLEGHCSTCSSIRYFTDPSIPLENENYGFRRLDRREALDEEIEMLSMLRWDQGLNARRWARPFHDL